MKFASHPKFGELLTIDPFELIKGKRIEGSWGGSIKPDEDLNRIVNDIKNNNLFIEIMNQDIYGIEEINKAILDMREGKVLRPILKFK